MWGTIERRNLIVTNTYHKVKKTNRSSNEQSEYNVTIFLKDRQTCDRREAIHVAYMSSFIKLKPTELCYKPHYKCHM